MLIIQDFADNRKALYNMEVKSAHFGKAQVTLHPSVCFYRDEAGHLIRHVIMHMSDDICHDYHAVNAFTEGCLEILRLETDVKQLILWSDGAASQYKTR